MLEYELDGTMAGVRAMLTDVQANAVYANHFAGVLAIDPAALAAHLPEAPELYSVVLVEVPPQRRVEVSQILQSMMQLPLPQARKLLDKLPYPLDFGSEKEAAQKAAQALQNAGAVIFTLGFESD